MVIDQHPCLSLHFLYNLFWQQINVRANKGDEELGYEPRINGVAHIPNSIFAACMWGVSTDHKIVLIFRLMCSYEIRTNQVFETPDLILVVISCHYSIVANKVDDLPLLQNCCLTWMSLLWYYYGISS